MPTHAKKLSSSISLSALLPLQSKEKTPKARTVLLASPGSSLVPQSRRYVKSMHYNLRGQIEGKTEAATALALLTQVRTRSGSSSYDHHRHTGHVRAYLLIMGTVRASRELQHE